MGRDNNSMLARTGTKKLIPQRWFSTGGEFYPGISKIAYEGPQSKNPLAFKHYDADQVVMGKTMKEHLKFSVVYWHTFRNGGHDPFGIDSTVVRPWGDTQNGKADSVENAVRRVDA